jgi:hypothetical protein
MVVFHTAQHHLDQRLAAGMGVLMADQYGRIQTDDGVTT